MIFRDEEKQKRMRQTLDDSTLKQRIAALPLSTKYTYDTPSDPNQGRIGITRIDPMSPYVPPVSTMKYDNIVEVINNKPFKAVFPQSFTPISEYFLRNRMTPYFNPGIDSDLAPGSITIAGMIDVIDQRLPLILEREEDIEPIIAILELYKKTVGQLNDRKIQAYITKVDRFLLVMEDTKARMYRRHGKISDTSFDIGEYFRQLLKAYEPTQSRR